MKLPYFQSRGEMIAAARGVIPMTFRSKADALAILAAAAVERPPKRFRTAAPPVSADATSRPPAPAQAPPRPEPTAMELLAALAAAERAEAVAELCAGLNVEVERGGQRYVIASPFEPARNDNGVGFAALVDMAAGEVVHVRVPAAPDGDESGAAFAALVDSIA